MNYFFHKLINFLFFISVPQISSDGKIYCFLDTNTTKYCPMEAITFAIQNGHIKNKDECQSIKNTFSCNDKKNDNQQLLKPQLHEILEITDKSCIICKGRMNDPKHVINMLYIGTDTCERMAVYAMKGKIPRHLCDPLRHYSKEPCQCTDLSTNEINKLKNNNIKK